MSVIEEILRGLQALQKGLCDEVSVQKESEDRTVIFEANKIGATLRTMGVWGSCRSSHSWLSTDYLSEAKTVLSVGFHITDEEFDLDRLIMQIKLESEVDDFHLEFTE